MNRVGRAALSRLSLRSKLLLLTMLPMLVSIAVVLALDFRLRADAAEQQLQQRTRAVLLALDHDVARLVYAPSRELAVDITQRLEAFPDVERLYVFGSDGRVILAYQKPSWSGTPPLVVPSEPGAQIKDDYLFVSSAVGDFATILAQSNMSSVRAARSSALRVSLGLGLLLLLVGVSTILGLQRSFSRRILALERTANEVVRSKDYSIRANTDQRDELGTIALALNSLLSTVEETLASLRKREASLTTEMERRTAAQEEVRNVERQLQASQKLDSLGRLAGGIAHDFNNLLTAILGQAELIEMTQPDTGASVIIDASIRASELTAQLLSFSKKAHVDLRPIDLGTLLDELERLLARVIPSTITLDVNLDPKLWDVHADAGRLQQVLLNLAINARDAMPRGGKLVLSAQNLVTSNDGRRREFVVLRVSDTGHGMDAATLERALEPFFTTKGQGGSGLGLAVAYGIMQQFGGSLVIESSLDGGTVVELRLPRSSERQRVVSSPAPRNAPAASGESTILLVEDDDIVRITTERVLREAGYRILTARDGAVALTQWQANRASIDLLVTDMVMPTMDGVELATKLRLDRPRLPVILVSGYTEHPSFEELDKEGLFVFLTKPYRSAAFLSSIESLLEPDEVCGRGATNAPIPIASGAKKSGRGSKPSKRRR